MNAVLVVFDVVAEQVDREFTNPGARQKAIKRFAELIIKDCVGVVESNAKIQATIGFTEHTNHNKSQDWVDGYADGVKEYGAFLLRKNAAQIKQHFGIENE